MISGHEVHYNPPTFRSKLLFDQIVLTKDYQLIDFGRGRKLERFDNKLLDRPCPAADGLTPALRAEWRHASHRFVDKIWMELARDGVEFTTDDERDNWVFRWNSVSMKLHASPFGHVGVFPEQVENWDWITQIGTHRRNWRSTGSKVTALNLFAYTGGSTLALASCGFEVTHVDASKPSVLWAKRNAAQSNADQLPIRWIVDDARDFVLREIRRKQQYDFIVLDPPAFGHGANGKRWEIERDLPGLMDGCRQLLSESPIAVLLTGHSPIDSMEYGPLDKPTFTRLSDCFRSLHAKRSTLTDVSGRELDCGYLFRWTH